MTEPAPYPEYKDSGVHMLIVLIATANGQTIHPFLDGNGRLGRLLITFILCAEKVLSQPLLYLSLHFKQHRDTYYELLQEVRMTGDWERWLTFFLEGVIETSNQAVHTARRLLDLFLQDRAHLQNEAASVLRLHEALQHQPVLSASAASKIIGASAPTVNTGFKKLESLGLVRELTGGTYGRLYGYSAYLDILAEGADPL